jgi:hypothetical protein
MKKIFVLALVLAGAATASQAGVRFNVGFNLPLPAPGVIVQTAATYDRVPVCEQPVAVCAPDLRVAEYVDSCADTHVDYRPEVFRRADREIIRENVKSHSSWNRNGRNSRETFRQETSERRSR